MTILFIAEYTVRQISLTPLHVNIHVGQKTLKDRLLVLVLLDPVMGVFLLFYCKLTRYMVDTFLRQTA